MMEGDEQWKEWSKSPNMRQNPLYDVVAFVPFSKIFTQKSKCH
jgi:hypothetical protein